MEKEKKPKFVAQKDTSPGILNVPAFDMMQTLSQIKISIPLLEMMSIQENRDNAFSFLNKTPCIPLVISNNNFNVEEVDEHIQGDIPITMQGPEVYLGTTITKIPSQVDSFFMTFLINGKYVNNCMIDSGAAINIMPMGVMRELGLKVDCNYRK